MEPNSGVIPNGGLRKLHADGIDREPEIRELLERAQRAGIDLESRLNLALERQSARIEEVDDRSLLLRTKNFDAEQPIQIFLNLALDGRFYFFSVPRLQQDVASTTLRVGLPTTIFHTERRERPRSAPRNDSSDPTRVMMRADDRPRVEAEIDDLSATGLLLRLPEQDEELPTDFRVSFVDGALAGKELFGAVRHRSPVSERPGWQRIGVSTSAAPNGPQLPVERRDAILPTGRVESARRRWDLLGAGAKLAAGRTLRRLSGRSPKLPKVRTIEFRNDQGERLKGILDSCGDVRGAPLVIMPPAWAKTKETLLPLARTIVESFDAANERVAVLRLDGIRRRGESHNDPDCIAPGSECHHMTFSQGAADILAAIEHFRSSAEFEPSTIILVTFSGAAIEARRALTSTRAERIGGWVSVVGAADLKSGLRTVSGGVDYIGGAEREVNFGIQRILGIEVDMDRVAADAVANDMAYLEDARCEMAKLGLPITWIQGRHDAWIDPDRVREILSCGDSSKRRLIEVPTGHQLRSSQEALQTFQLVAQEIGRIVIGREIVPTPPDLAGLERRRLAERARLPKAEVDLKHFWRDYLLGREQRLGMELLTVSTPYRDLMRTQIDALELQADQRIGDLGSGTGAFPLHLLEHCPEIGPLQIDEMDYVPEALERARERLAAKGPSPLVVRYLECDLDQPGENHALPGEDGSYDRLVASLLLNYVKSPESLLAEVQRLLRPGGRFVLSVLRRDVDISRIYMDVASELRAGAAMEPLGVTDQRIIEEDLREFLNEAARLVDLEERGIFHFWDADGLVAHLRDAGFVQIETAVSFGSPPQAIVASAVRP